MDKTEFIKELGSKLSYMEDRCIIINDILESNFFISKSNKDKIVEEFMIKLDVNQAEALKIYDISCALIKEQVKNKLKHPFKSKD